MKIAHYRELYLDVPLKAWYSFFNSPYVGHRSGAAVDVYYPDLPLFPLESGKVVEIRGVKAPKHLPKEEDYVIAVQVSEKICLKILHVKPKIGVGEKLHLGDPLGEMLISGFFMSWSSKHAHFELRNCNDRIRARGGLPLTSIVQDRVPAAAGAEFIVKEKHAHFYWLSPQRTSGQGLTPIGTPAIEGGLPHYGYGAVFGNTEKINIFGKDLQIVRRFDNIGLFNISLDLQVEGQKVTGIGIYCNQEKIKLIGGNFEVGEKIKI